MAEDMHAAKRREQCAASDTSEQKDEIQLLSNASLHPNS
jgi:hypothetical protein